MTVRLGGGSRGVYVCGGVTSSSAGAFLTGAARDGGVGGADWSSFLAGDASLPGGQHVVEGVSADAGPAGGANQRRATE